jgi:hypothetical protein
MHTLVANSAQESIELVTKMVPHFLKLIGETLAVVGGDKALLRKRNELQGQLCAALQVRRVKRHAFMRASCLKFCGLRVCNHYQ